jgi:hypothetical protein
VSQWNAFRVPWAGDVGRMAAVFGLLGLMWSPPNLSACSCEWSGPFLRAAHRADLVVRGTVTEYVKGSRGRGAMDIRVLEAIRGSTGQQTVRIQGGNDSDCVPSVRRFPIGTQWVFALHDSAGEARQSYSMLICGENWVRFERGLVRGNIAGPFQGADTESLDLDQLRSLVSMGLRALIPDHDPHLVGVVRVASAWSLDIETGRKGPPGLNYARVFLSRRTLVIDRRGREYPKLLPAGTRVSVWFPGSLAPFQGTSEHPFPVSAQVVAVIVEDFAR